MEWMQNNAELLFHSLILFSFQKYKLATLDTNFVVDQNISDGKRELLQLVNDKRKYSTYINPLSLKHYLQILRKDYYNNIAVMWTWDDRGKKGIFFSLKLKHIVNSCNNCLIILLAHTLKETNEAQFL